MLEYKDHYVKQKIVAVGKTEPWLTGGHIRNDGSFFCSYNNIESITKKLAVNCSTDIREMNDINKVCCSQLKINNWSDPLFFCRDSLEKTSNFLSKNQCIVDDSDKLSVEKSALNMDHKLVEVIVWFFAFASVVGNAGVFLHCLVTNFRKKPTGSSAKTHRFLILNLALADLLMGFYLSIYAFQHLHTGENGHDHDELKSRLESLMWMESNSCLAMGILSFISSQVSVTLLIIITYFRLKTTINPFDVNSKAQMRQASLLTFITWFFWLVIAILPTIDVEEISSIFNNFVRFSSTNFCYGSRNQPEVHYNFLRQIVNDVYNASTSCNFEFEAYNNLKKPSWKELINSAQQLKLVPGNTSVVYYGYYNERSVCTATYFASISSPSMPFTMIVITFNLFSFAFIILAYIWIWKSSSATRSLPTVKHNSIKLNSRNLNSHYKTRHKSFPNFNLSSSKNIFSARLSFAIAKLSTGRSNNAIQTIKTIGQRAKENRRMQRRILIMILTDFFCWVPLCIFAIVFTVKTATLNPHSPSYHEFLEQFYPILDTFTLVVLPINSSLNPFIYSSRFWCILHGKVARFWKKHKKTETNTECIDSTKITSCILNSRSISPIQ